MTYKVGVKGQVVLPKRIRERLDIRPGDDVAIDQVDDEIRVRRVPRDRPKLRGMFADVGGSLTAALEESRREEREREEAKIQRMLR